MFLTFAGEELGLLGSEWYVNHPALPLENAVAMINMDMIGRIRDGKVYVSGTGTGSTFAKLLEDVKPPAPLQIDLSEKDRLWRQRSHFVHHQAGPGAVLFLRPARRLSQAQRYCGQDRRARRRQAAGLRGATDRRTLTNDPDARSSCAWPSQSRARSAPAGGSGYGPNFGSIPDFNEPPKGVRFADVRDGTPAAKAGLKAGDILIEFDGKEIGNLYDFTYALRAHKPGDLVLVKVLRGSQTIEAKVLLTERR